MTLKDDYKTATDKSKKTDIIIATEPAAFILDNEYKYDPFNDIPKESKATLFVVDENNESVIQPYQNFILNSIAFGEQDRYQLSEMYEGFDLLMLGKRPITVNMGLSVFNTTNKSWRDEFIYNYRNFFSGNIAAREGYKTFFIVDNIYIEGVIISYSLSINAPSDSMTMLSLGLVSSEELIYPIIMKGKITPGHPDTKNIQNAWLKSIDPMQKETAVERV